MKKQDLLVNHLVLPSQVLLHSIQINMLRLVSRLSELFGDEQELKEKIANVCTLKNVMLEHLYHQPLLNEEEIFNTLMEYKEMVEPYVCDTSAFLHQALKGRQEDFT